MPEKRRKHSHSPTWVGSGNGIKRLRLRKSLDNDEDSSESEPSSGGEDSEEFSEYRPTTDSEYSSDEYDKTSDVLNYRGLVIRKGQFVFVKNDSTEDWIARVERVCGKKRRLYVRWMREDGPEIVMEDDFAWLSVDTVQDVAQLRPRVHPPSIEERWMYKVPTKPAPLSPPGDEHMPLRTVSAEHSGLKITETIFRLTSQDCDIAGTAWYPLGDSEGDTNPVSETTTKTKLAPVRLGASRQWNLPPLWEVLGDYRHHHPW